FSICTGALVLGAAGLLKGRAATSYWPTFDLLKYFGAVPTNERVVIDGNLVTAAGLTAGIDGALAVAAMFRGDAAAKAIQLALEYAPDPPFDCGSPGKAPAEIVATPACCMKSPGKSKRGGSRSSRSRRKSSILLNESCRRP